MAFTNENITLIGQVVLPVLLGTSTEFIVQNTKHDTLRFKITGSSIEGGQIPRGGTFKFAYDIDLWNPSGKDGESIIIYLVRN